MIGALASVTVVEALLLCASFMRLRNLEPRSELSRGFLTRMVVPELAESPEEIEAIPEQPGSNAR